MKISTNSWHYKLATRNGGDRIWDMDRGHVSSCTYVRWVLGGIIGYVLLGMIALMVLAGAADFLAWAVVVIMTGHLQVIDVWGTIFVGGVAIISAIFVGGVAIISTITAICTGANAIATLINKPSDRPSPFIVVAVKQWYNKTCTKVEMIP